MSLVFEPVAPTVLPVAGGGEFPVHRVYCVGRNYAEHAQELGHTGREPPFFFMKPADALVPVPEGKTGVMAYPTLTPHPPLPVLRPAHDLPDPGRRQPRARGLQRLWRDPLREPAQRRRYGAGVGSQRPAVPSKHRAAQGPVDPAGGLPRARRVDRRGRAARDRRGSRRTHRDAGPVHRAERRAGRPGSPLLPRAAARPPLRPPAGRVHRPLRGSMFRRHSRTL